MESTRKERLPLTVEYAHLEKARKYSSLGDFVEKRSRNTVDITTFRAAGFFSAFLVKAALNPLHRVKTIIQCWRECFPLETTRPSIREIVDCKLNRYQEESGNSGSNER